MTVRARRKPTPRQLEVLATYARTGSYKVTAEELGIARGTVHMTLVLIRGHYQVDSTIQAYRAAVAAGHISRGLVGQGR